MALTDDERDRLNREYEQKSRDTNTESTSNLSALGMLTVSRAQADRLARQRALRLEAVEKKEEQELKVCKALYVRTCSHYQT